MEKIRGKSLQEWKDYCDSDNVPMKTMKYITVLEDRIKQLTIPVVGSSSIAEPYLICEKTYQIKEMQKLGLYSNGYLFEQNINGLIQVIKDLREQ